MLSCYRDRYTRLSQSELLAYTYIAPLVLAIGVARRMTRRPAWRVALQLCHAPNVPAKDQRHGYAVSL